MAATKRRVARGPQAEQPLRKKPRGRRGKGDNYEAEDSDPEEVKHAERYDAVDNFEYELPPEFEDEEIDEDTAFTAEDEKKYGAWFGGSDAVRRASAADIGGGRDEFADLYSSDEERAGGGSGSEGGSEDWDEGDEEALAAWDEAGDGDGQADGAEGGGPGGEDPSDAEDPSDGGGGLSTDEEGEEGEERRHRAMVEAVLGPGALGRGGPVAARPRFVRRVVGEAYPESEFHVTPASASGGGGEVTLAEMMAGLGEARARLGAGAKLLDRLAARAAPLAAPLPRIIRERQQRRAGYEASAKEVSKWQPLVKANREAPSLAFTSGAREAARPSTTRAMAAAHRPETDMEAEVAALLAAAGAGTAAAMQEAEQALAVKELSLAEASERQSRLARMRHLLFYSELKAKRLSKIKSKAFHRVAARSAARKTAKAAADGDVEGEEEAARRAAEVAEFERAKERLTLKHRNTSRWARRALRRGANLTDAGTKAALAEQQALGAELRRRVERGGEGREGGGGSGTDSDGGSTSASEGEGAAEGEGARASSRSRREALDILRGLTAPEQGEEGSSLFRLPFMMRAMERRRREAAQQAAALVADLEGGGAGGAGGDADPLAGGAEGFGGRLSFGAATPAAEGEGVGEARGEEGVEDSEEEDVEAKAEWLGRRVGGEQQQQQQPAAAERARGVGKAAAAAAGAPLSERRPPALSAASAGPLSVVALPNGVAHAASAATATAASAGAAAASPAPAPAGWEGAARAATHAQQASLFEAPSTSAPPAFQPSATFKGERAGYAFKRGPRGVGYYVEGAAPAQRAQGRRTRSAAGAADGHRRLPAEAAAAEGEGEGDAPRGPTPGGGEGAGVAAAFAVAEDDDDAADAAAGMRVLAGDADAQRALVARAFAADDVAADFAAAKAAEVEAELPAADTPGVMPGWGTWAGVQRQPRWVKEAAAKAERARAVAAAGRADAKLRHVVVSEKWDRQAAKLSAAALPFPFTSKEVYEAALRQPLGREYQTDAAFRDLTRPAVLKETGVVIQPLRYSRPMAQYSAGAAGKARGVVTVAAGMALQAKPGAAMGGAPVAAKGKGKAAGGGGGVAGKARAGGRGRAAAR